MPNDDFQITIDTTDSTNKEIAEIQVSYNALVAEYAQLCEMYRMSVRNLIDLLKNFLVFNVFLISVLAAIASLKTHGTQINTEISIGFIPYVFFIIGVLVSFGAALVQYRIVKYNNIFQQRGETIDNMLSTQTFTQINSYAMRTGFKIRSTIVNYVIFMLFGFLWTMLIFYFMFGNTIVISISNPI